MSLNGSLQNYNLKFWSLGGDNMEHLDLSIFIDQNKVFAIIDSDPGSSKVRKKFIKNCKENKIACYKLERYSIENYFPLNLIRMAFPNQIPKEISVLEKHLPVDKQIGFKAKGKSIKGKNAIIANGIKRENIEDTDLWNIVETIYNKVSSTGTIATAG